MNNRILRINEDIQRELAALLRGIKDPRIKNRGLLSITAVDTSADLGHANVYLSVFQTDPNEAQNSRKELLSGLKSASGHLRYELGKVLSLRHTPELKFILDDSIERGAKINNLLSGLGAEDSMKADSEAVNE